MNHSSGADSGSRSLVEQIAALAQDVESDVIAWRQDIHQHPELSNRETRTAAKVSEHLRGLGMEVRTDIAPTGVVGVLVGGAPGNRVIALRADMDALPVKETANIPFASTVVDHDYPGGPFPVAHSCGHDAHTAMLMGAASVLARMQDSIPGTVLFVFQPAEEGPPLGEPFGAQAMLDAGAFKDPRPDAVFGVHVGPYPKGTIEYGSGVFFAASELLEITIHGQQTHGAFPFMGLDPIPVLAAIDNGISQIYREIDPNKVFTISLGKIDTVGRANIIGDTLTAWGTARATDGSILDDLNIRMQRVVEHAALMHGLTADFSVHQHVPPLINATDWVRKFVPSLEKVVGKENIFEVNPVMGYDDVSVLTREFGGMYVSLGAQNTKFQDGLLVPAGPNGNEEGPIPNHHPAFVVLDEVLVTGVRAHAQVAIDFLSGN